MERRFKEVPGEYYCTKCLTEFSYESELNNHPCQLVQHLKEDNFLYCDTCGTTFNKNKVKQKFDNDKKELSLICPVCELQKKTYEALYRIWHQKKENQDPMHYPTYDIFDEKIWNNKDK